MPFTEKQTKNKFLCLAKDQGIYLVTCCVDPGEDTKLVCYAQGRGKDAQMNGDDYVEKVPLSPGLISDLERGADMVIDITETSMKILTLVKANQLPNNKNTTQMKKVKSIAEKAAEMESTDTTTKDPAKEVKKKKKKKKTETQSQENLTDANVTKAAKDIQTERNTKYIYPEGYSNKDKKDFRRKARATIADFTKKIGKLTKSEDEKSKKELKNINKEFTAWKEQHLSPEEA
jgi:hypothetical protein